MICKHLYIVAMLWHDDVIKWKHFPRYWPFVWGIHRSPVNSPHKGQWRGALMFSLICVWIKGRGNNGEAGDLRRNRAHYDVIVMKYWFYKPAIMRVYDQMTNSGTHVTKRLWAHGWNLVKIIFVLVFILNYLTGSEICIWHELSCHGMWKFWLDLVIILMA